MSKSKHVTFGAPGQHEFYLPTTGRGHENRRDRRRCCHYYAETKYCSKIRNQCVGPTVCMKYHEAEKIHKESGRSHKKDRPGVGTIVYSAREKEGKIVTISGDICTIQFSTGKKVSARYPDAFEKGIFMTEKDIVK